MDTILWDVFSNSKYCVNVRNTKSLHPLPILGIPNWWPNRTEVFYDNEQYFRTRKMTGSYFSSFTKNTTKEVLLLQTIIGNHLQKMDAILPFFATSGYVSVYYHH